MDSLLQDVRFAWRQLRKDPGFTAVAVVTLALGIGASTSIFTVVDGVLLKPLNYPDPDRLIALHVQTGKYGDQCYYALTQMPDSLTRFFSSVMSVAIRTDVDPLSMVEALQRQARGSSGDQALYEVRTMEQLVRALGATTGNVMQLVLRQGLILALAGAGIGTVMSAAAGRILQRMVAGVPGPDPIVFCVIVAVLFAVALLACYLPARRAAKVDPMVALRYE